MAKKTKQEIVDQDRPIRFSVMRVKELGFAVNERFFTPEKSNFKVSYNHEYTYSPYGFIRFSLMVRCLYDDSTNDVLFAIDVENVFGIDEIERFIDSKKSIKLPLDFLTTVVSISVSHSRALLAKNTAGSVFGDFVLPVVNPREMAEKFFPEAK